MAGDKKEEKTEEKKDSEEKGSNSTPYLTEAQLKRMFSDLTYGGDPLDNLLLSRPKEAFEYDTLASTMQLVTSMYVGKYFNTVYDRAHKKGETRVKSAFSSSNPELAKALDKILSAVGVDGDSIDTIVGQGGASQAVEELIATAYSVAGASGMPHASPLLNPSRYKSGMMFGINQGALAYNNNFNADGSINVRQTHGLSLPYATVIAQRALAERSQYLDWADRVSNKESPGLSVQDKQLTDREIQNFSHGMGATARSQESFNAHIKKFTEQINGFVSSVSKMTGSYEDAIDFLQRVTGGQLFTAGKKADSARALAGNMAMGFRLAAAEARVEPEDLYANFKAHGLIVANSNGFDINTAIYNKNNAMSMLPMLSALGHATWRSMHPNAGLAEATSAELGLQEMLDDYSRGDMRKMNTLSAFLIDQGLAPESEIKGIVESGDAMRMFEYLGEKFGGKERVEKFLQDGLQMHYLESQHAETAKRLHQAGYIRGLDNEQQRVGRINRLEGAKFIFASLLGQAKVEDADKAAQEIERMHEKSMLDQKVLESAGLSSDEASKLIEKGTQEKWAVSTIREKVRQAKGDVDILEFNSAESFIKKLEEKYSDEDPGAFKTIKEEYTKTFGGVITDRDRAYTMAHYLADEKGRKIQAVKQAVIEARGKDPSTQATAAAALNELARKGRAGDDSYAFYDNTYLDTVFLTGLKEVRVLENGELKELDEGALNKRIGRARQAFGAAIAAGSTQNVAFAEAEKAAFKSGDVSVSKDGKLKKFGVETREEAYGSARLDAMASSASRALIEKYNFNLDPQTSETRFTDLLNKVRARKQQHPTLDDASIIREALNEVYKEEIGKAINALNKLEDGQLDFFKDGGSFYTTVNEAGYSFDSQRIKVDDHAILASGLGDQLRFLPLTRIVTDKFKEEVLGNGEIEDYDDRQRKVALAYFDKRMTDPKADRQKQMLESLKMVFSTELKGKDDKLEGFKVDLDGMVSKNTAKTIASGLVNGIYTQYYSNIYSLEHRNDAKYKENQDALNSDAAGYASSEVKNHNKELETLAVNMADRFTAGDTTYNTEADRIKLWTDLLQVGLTPINATSPEDEEAQKKILQRLLGLDAVQSNIASTIKNAERQEEYGGDSNPSRLASAFHALYVGKSVAAKFRDELNGRSSSSGSPVRFETFDKLEDEVRNKFIELRSDTNNQSTSDRELYRRVFSDLITTHTAEDNTEEGRVVLDTLKAFGTDVNLDKSVAQASSSEASHLYKLAMEDKLRGTGEAEANAGFSSGTRTGAGYERSRNESIMFSPLAKATQLYLNGYAYTVGSAADLKSAERENKAFNQVGSEDYQLLMEQIGISDEKVKQIKDLSQEFINLGVDFNGPKEGPGTKQEQANEFFKVYKAAFNLDDKQALDEFFNHFKNEAARTKLEQVAAATKLTVPSILGSLWEGLSYEAKNPNGEDADKAYTRGIVSDFARTHGIDDMSAGSQVISEKLGTVIEILRSMDESVGNLSFY